MFVGVEFKRGASIAVAVAIVERAIALWGAKEKRPILLLQYWKNGYFHSEPKKISHF